MTMSRQDIIDMAVQSGFDDITPWLDAESVDQGVIDAANRWIDKMVSFAALVGFRVYEVEQEQCAAKVVSEGVAEYERGLKDGAALERESCAKVAEGFEQNRDWVRGSLYESIRNEVAARIRARGEVQP